VVKFHTRASSLRLSLLQLANCFVPVRTRNLRVQDESITGQHHLETSSFFAIRQEGHIDISTAPQGKLPGFPLSSHITLQSIHHQT
jgi:hypothetical protein